MSIVIARDWRALADFYANVFGCEFVPPRARLPRRPIWSAGTGVPGAALRGAHLRLPGLGPDGPTLEIYQFESMPEGCRHAANRPGFQHIAFAVPVGRRGARAPSSPPAAASSATIVTLQTADGRFVTWTYVTDPEGNIIELQSWSDVRPAVTG